MTEKRWWGSIPEADLDADFDSEDLNWDSGDDESRDYVGDMWGRFGYDASTPIAAKAVVAHGMVQTFVNAFARGGRYRVDFSDKVSTAGTDLQARKIVITTAPLSDPTLSAQEAGLVLTGMAAHEVSHDRYGRSTAAAVRRAFGASPMANRLSNLLDDVRIERRFVTDYPGYAAVFAPLLSYVATKGGRAIQPTLKRPSDLAIAAIRFESHADWSDPDVAAEAAWWKRWATIWSREDAPKRHVEAIRQALKHLNGLKTETDPKPKPAPPPSPQPASPGSTEGDQASADGGDDQDDFEQADVDGQDDATDDATQESKRDDDSASPDDEPEMTDEELGKTGEAPSPDALPDEIADAVDAAAEANGALTNPYDAQRAQNAVERSRDLEADGIGGMIDVARTTKGLLHKDRLSRLKPSAHATAAVRNAFMRSRTGSTGVDRGMTSGRLDNKSLARIAEGDDRLFSRRIAPDPGRVLVWAMVDESSSMISEIGNAAQVAEAIASASRTAPNVRMAVWGWSDSFRPDYRGGVDGGVVKVWETGQPTKNVFDLTRLTMGTTPDAHVLSWAWRAILKDTRTGERPIILMMTDGAGNTRDLINNVIVEARRHGVDVRSVALGRAVTEESQLRRYGRGGYVAWRGTMMEMARPLATLVSNAAAGRSAR
jgi:hypothetical protein